MTDLEFSLININLEIIPLMIKIIQEAVAVEIFKLINNYISDKEIIDLIYN